MFVLCFAILVALASQPVEGRIVCCYPTQMEGARYFLEQEQTKYFVADYDRGYIFETLQIGRPNFTIIDLQNRMIYTVEGEECSDRPMREPGLYDPCLHDGDVTQYNTLLGGEDQTIEVDFYNYNVGRYSVFKAVKFDRDGCFPVATQTRIGRFALTTIYHNVQADISFPSIFSSLEICNVEVRGGGEEEGNSSDSSSSDSDE